jgi:diadenosine tetraphosphate (Ap4A) HIT family hydrolase
VTDCAVCAKHRGERPPPGGPVHEDDLVYASHAFDLLGTGEDSYLAGHLMVEPKRHVAGLADATDDEAAAIGRLVSRLARALVASEGAEHVYSFVMGHQTPHLHVHVLPRYPGTPREYWFLAVYDWDGARRCGPDEIAAVTGRIRTQLRF